MGLFGPETTTWKVNKEAVLLLGGSRALLMQVAHPLVAQGVAEHSNFLQDPLGRLYRTLTSMLDIVFGDEHDAEAAIARINSLHEKVKGRLPRRAGPYRARQPYRARDPRLLLWVHATLFDSSVQLYELFVGKLTEAEKNRYHQESFPMAKLLGVPRHVMPKDYDAFQAYLYDTLHDETLTVTKEGREIAQAVLYPPLPFIHHRLFEPQKFLTVGLLPAPLRERFGFRWSLADEAAYRAAVIAIRRLIFFLPPQVRYMPQYLRAMRRLRAARGEKAP